MEEVYTFLKRAWYSIKPFIGASALYFDISKDISLAILIYSALQSMTGGFDMSGHNLSFEYSLLAALVGAIIFVQISWMSISQCTVSGYCGSLVKSRPFLHSSAACAPLAPSSAVMLSQSTSESLHAAHKGAAAINATPIRFILRTRSLRRRRRHRRPSPDASCSRSSASCSRP